MIGSDELMMQSLIKALGNILCDNLNKVGDLTIVECNWIGKTIANIELAYNERWHEICRRDLDIGKMMEEAGEC